MIISLPHFYAADPKLTEDIGGLHPNEEDHAISMDFELVSNYYFIHIHNDIENVY